MTRMKLTFGPPDVTVERRSDGAMLVRSLLRQLGGEPDFNPEGLATFFVALVRAK